MTHDELLARIEEKIESLNVHPIILEGGTPEQEKYWSEYSIRDIELTRAEIRAWEALRAVLELHKPEVLG